MMLTETKREVPMYNNNGHGHIPSSHSNSHRPSPHTLMLDDFDVDQLAHDLNMRKEELNQRLQSPESLQHLKVPQIRRILQHVRKKSRSTTAGLSSMNKPELLKEAKESLYRANAGGHSGYVNAGSLGSAAHTHLSSGSSSLAANRGMGGSSHMPQHMPQPALQYDHVNQVFPAFEERAKRITGNPFFVVEKTLLVKDVILSGSQTAFFKLDPGWQLAPNGARRSVHVRIFEYDASLLRGPGDSGRIGAMKETAWAMQGLLRVNDIVVPQLPKKKKYPPPHPNYTTPPTCLDAVPGILKDGKNSLQVQLTNGDKLVLSVQLGTVRAAEELQVPYTYIHTYIHTYTYIYI